MGDERAEVERMIIFGCQYISMVLLAVFVIVWCMHSQLEKEA